MVNGSQSRPVSFAMNLDRLTTTPPTTPMGRPARLREIDWNAVERDYRAGDMSLRQLAARHSCSHSAIANRAGALGWRREPR